MLELNSKPIFGTKTKQHVVSFEPTPANLSHSFAYNTLQIIFWSKLKSIFLL